MHEKVFMSISEGKLLGSVSQGKEVEPTKPNSGTE